jgi:flagellar protein FliO/FliZ
MQASHPGRACLVPAMLAGAWTTAAHAAGQAAHRFAEPSASQAVPAPAAGLAQVTFALVLVLGAVFAAAWLLRRLRGFGGAKDGNAIAVVAERAVGPRERVVLLQVDGERVLVGVASGQVRALHVLAPQSVARPAGETK